jgi:hypothetical protein
MAKGKTFSLKHDKRRKHHHFQVIVSYPDGEMFSRVYTDEESAAKFATRQKRSPMVKSAKVMQLS